MKKVNLSHITKPDFTSIRTARRRFRIQLGNGVNKEFRCGKKAKAYLEQTNVYLTFKLHELNLIYISIFTYYRQGFWYFDPQATRADKAKWYEDYRKIKHFMLQTDAQIDLIIDRSHFENGNYLTFSHFKTLFSYMKDSLVILKSLSHKRREYSLNYDLECTYSRLEALENEINGYDDPVPTEKIDLSKIIYLAPMEKVM